MSSRIPGLVALASILIVPLAATPTAAQESSTTKDSAACLPPSVMGLGEEIMSAGVTPYGMMDGMVPGTMTDLGMMDYGLSMTEPDRAVILEVMQFQPGRVLKLKDQLGLTTDQVASLEALVATHWNADHDRRIAMEPEVEKLQSLFEAPTPDTTAVRFEAEQVIALRNELYVRLMTDGAAVRALLNPEQRNVLLTGPFAPEHLSTPATHPENGHRRARP
jgi:Spy/CpxP family protein refolding chaperone